MRMTEKRRKVLAWWCNATHAGGHVTRDAKSRINWQCSTCGRWATPVSHDEERRVVNRELDEHRERITPAGLRSLEAERGS